MTKKDKGWLDMSWIEDDHKQFNDTYKKECADLIAQVGRVSILNHTFNPSPIREPAYTVTTTKAYDTETEIEYLNHKLQEHRKEKRLNLFLAFASGLVTGTLLVEMLHSIIQSQG